MPSTLTKKARLSSGLGVNISKWPRWAKSIIGSVTVVLVWLLTTIFRFSGPAVFGRAAENLAAVGQNNLPGVGCFVVVLGAEAFHGHLIAGFQRIPRPSHARQRVRCAVLALPVLQVALCIGHVQINPDMRV